MLSALFLYSLPNIKRRWSGAGANDFGLYGYGLPYFYLMSNTALTASVWLVCCLMFDRYRRLCAPFTIRANNVSRLNWALLGVCLLALAFSMPRYFELYAIEVGDRVMIAQTALVHNRGYLLWSVWR